MEEQIKKTAARVRTTFAYFWMLPILLVLLGETGGGWVGMYAGDVRATYMAETVTILLAASCVPIALKLFSWVLIRKIDVVTLPEALRLYALWSGVRLFRLHSTETHPFTAEIRFIHIFQSVTFLLLY